ncbi:MAG TPA: YebC/PmpR family DNA-binding transcriptional regulator [Lentisphaeria bacterium]|nr:YebC/PmpR family DNA-binding transcriptional regulator [Lentisphaeria bacterium]
MSGHSKWSTIKHKKAAADAKRGKAFSRVAKEITLAAKIGGKDPDANPRLRTAISSGKSVNMPNDNIARAIAKGAGELGDAQLEELVYEGYATAGVGLVVDCLSENRNRTAAEIRNIFSKGNGNMADSGAVSRMFQRKARFLLSGPAADEEKLMELCFEHEVDIEDILVHEDTAEIIAQPVELDSIITMLEACGLTPDESGVARVPDLEVPVGDLPTARSILRLVDALEDNEDVQSVYCNADISEDILQQLAES